MQHQPWIRGYRLGFALLTFSAIAYQFTRGNDNPGFSPLNFFSFFTIQSNILGAVVFVLGATVLASRPASLRWDLARGGATMFLTTTFFVYGTLLSGLEESLQTPDPWVNAVLHQIFPIVVVIDMLLIPPSHRITFRQALVWTLYPLAYLAYSLLRGPVVDWYPYPFLDPDAAGGYAGVAGVSIGILIGFLMFAALIVWASGHIRLRVEVGPV